MSGTKFGRPPKERLECARCGPTTHLGLGQNEWRCMACGIVRVVEGVL